MPLEVSATSIKQYEYGSIKIAGSIMKMKQKDMKAGYDQKSEPMSNVRPKVLTNEDISFRVRVTQAIACVSHYAGTQSRLAKEWSKRELDDAGHECTRLGLLKESGGSYVATALGREFVESYGQDEFATHVRRLFESDEKLRFVWSAVSDIGDPFKKRDVTNLFLKISRSAGHPFKKSTAGQYAYRFLEWARAAKVCGSESFGQFRVKVRLDAPYTIPAEFAKPRNKPDTLRLLKSDSHEVLILRLNALIADMMSGEQLNENDLQAVDNILRNIKERGLIDRFIMDILEDTFNTAVRSNDPEVRKLAGRFLSRIRKKYFMKEQVQLTQFA